MAYLSGKIASVLSEPKVSTSTTTSGSGTTTHTIRTKHVNRFEVDGAAYTLDTSMPAPLLPGNLVKFRTGPFGSKKVKELCNHDNGYYFGPSAVPVFVLAALFTALLVAIYFFRQPFSGDVLAAPFERFLPAAVPYLPWAFAVVAVLLWVQGFYLVGLKKKVCTL